jgi:hypothetical protein
MEDLRTLRERIEENLTEHNRLFEEVDDIVRNKRITHKIKCCFNCKRFSYDYRFNPMYPVPINENGETETGIKCLCCFRNNIKVSPIDCCKLHEPKIEKKGE